MSGKLSRRKQSQKRVRKGSWVLQTNERDGEKWISKVDFRGPQIV